MNARLLTHITWEELGSLLSFFLRSREVKRQQGLVSGLVVILDNTKHHSVNTLSIMLKEPPNCP